MAPMIPSADDSPPSPASAEPVAAQKVQVAGSGAANRPEPPPLEVEHAYWCGPPDESCRCSTPG